MSFSPLVISILKQRRERSHSFPFEFLLSGLRVIYSLELRNGVFFENMGGYFATISVFVSLSDEV